MQYYRGSKYGEESDAPVRPQDFPKIARESGFSFTLRRGRVDWHKIDSINLDRLVQECDLTTLQENLNNVVNYNLDREYDVKILDQNFVKLFKLAQLSIDYLLYSEQHLFNCIDALYKENQELKNEMSVKENSQRNHQTKAKSRKKYGHQPISSYDHPTEYSKCHHCGKTFLSGSYLSSHILRRHPSAVLSDQSTETNVLRAEINDLKTRLKFAEQIKLDNLNTLDVGSSLKDWQANLQEQYRGEITTIKNLFVNEIKKLKETRSEVVHFPVKENKDLMELIQKQEQELTSIREHIQDKTQTSTELDTLRGQLEAQERFWKSRLNEAQSKHSEDIENLKAQLSELSKANETQSTLQDLVKHTKEHDKWLSLQAEQISKIAQWPNAVKPDSPISTSGPAVNCLIKLDDDTVGTDNSPISNSGPKMTVQTTLAVPKIIEQPITEPAKVRLHDNLKINMQTLAESSTNRMPQVRNVETKSIMPEDKGSMVREMSFSDTSSVSEGENGNVKKLNVVHYFPTKVLQAKQLESPKSVEEKPRNEDVQTLSSSITEQSKSIKQHVIPRTIKVPARGTTVPAFVNNANTTPMKQDSPTMSDNYQNHIVPKIETLTKALTPRSFARSETEKQQRVEELRKTDTEDSSSESSDDSGSTITDGSAAHDGPADLALHSVASMESALAKNPQILAAFKEDIVEQFENRLRELAVDPHWQGIPTANYNKNLATLQHHESIAAKKFKSFFEIKQNLGSRLDDRLGLQKNGGSSSGQLQNRSIKSDKLFKNIPGARRALLSDERTKKIIEKKSPPRPPSLFPRNDSNTLTTPHITKPLTSNEDSNSPYTNPTGSRIVTSTPLKDQVSCQNTPTSSQSLTDKSNLPSTSAPLRHGSFDDDIDSLLDESLKSPKRRFSNPVSKSQDFLDATPKTSREISPRSALKGALSTGSLITKKRVVFSDQDEFNVSEKRKSIHTNKNSSQISGKLYSGAGDTVDQTDSYTDSDFELSSNQEDDSPPMVRNKEPVIKLSTQQSNKIAQISHSIETQLRDTSRSKPVGGIEAMFQGSSFTDGAKAKPKEDLIQPSPVPRPRKSEAAAASKQSDLSDWDLEDLDDLLAN